MGKIVGIDLGTTNSLVAYIDPQTNQPKCIPGPYGDTLCHSVVSLDADGTVVVGEAARRRLLTQPERTIYSVKRLMGRGPADVQSELKLFPFRIEPSNKNVIRVMLGEKVFTPPEISAFILRELKNWAEAHFAEPVDRAVITVPAYFNDAQRQATKDAGKIAGLDVLRLVNEPTAAALAYGLHEKQRGKVAVYDLGGGTFDISILKLISTTDGDIFQVLSTNGDTHLGGDDIDHLLQAFVHEQILQHDKLDFSPHGELAQQLRKRLIALKHRLSEHRYESLLFPLPNGTNFRLEFTRPEFETLIRPVVDRTMGPVKQALADAQLNLGRDCRSLARFALKVPPAPAGLPRIEVKFLIDANGILQVAAKDLRTGERHSMEVQPSYGINDSEIERMLEESIEYAEQDFAERQVIEARTESESILTATAKALANPQAAGLSADERARIDASVAALQESVAGTDYKLIRKRIDELNHATEHLAELLMNSAVSTALEGRKLAEV